LEDCCPYNEAAMSASLVLATESAAPAAAPPLTPLEAKLRLVFATAPAFEFLIASETVSEPLVLSF